MLMKYGRDCSSSAMFDNVENVNSTFNRINYIDNININTILISETYFKSPPISGKSPIALLNHIKQQSIKANVPN